METISNSVAMYSDRKSMTDGCDLEPLNNCIADYICKYVPHENRKTHFQKLENIGISYKDAVLTKCFDYTDGQDEVTRQSSADEEILQCAGGGNGIKPSQRFAIKDNQGVQQLLNGSLNVGEHRLIERKPQDISTGTVDMTVEANRLNSFVGRWSPDLPVTPQDLSVAGLYYTGPGDRVVCAYCRGGLYNWQQGDTALGEHKAHFPQCPFIMENYDTLTNTGDAMASPEQNVEADNAEAMTENDTSSESQGHFSRGIAQQLGFSEDEIVKAVELLSFQGKELRTSTLIDALYEEEQMCDTSLEGAVATNTVTDITTDGPDQDACEVNAMSQLSPDSKRSNVKRQFSLHSLLEENNRLREITRCKVCLSDDVTLMFLPCRHIVCCEACNQALQDCPMCRTKIVATVKAFLA